MTDAVELHERLARVEEQARVNAHAIAELERKLEGPPREESVKGRLHTLENTNAIEAAATSALKALEAKAAANDVAGEAKRAGRDRRLALGFSALAIAVTLQPWRWLGLS